MEHFSYSGTLNGK